MPRRVIVLQGISKTVHIPIVVEDIRGSRYDGIRRDEGAHRGVVVAALVVQQAGGVAPLTGVVDGRGQGGACPQPVVLAPSVNSGQAPV